MLLTENKVSQVHVKGKKGTNQDDDASNLGIERSGSDFSQFRFAHGFEPFFPSS
jgi:hypothetical protein